MERLIIKKLGYKISGHGRSRVPLKNQKLAAACSSNSFKLQTTSVNPPGRSENAFNGRNVD